MECFCIVMAGWVFSVCLHEFAHAWAAYKGGDYTVREKGYLTFNPLKYTDAFSSIVLPIVFLVMGGIGLPGGAVYINRSLLRSRVWDTAVSLAGPAANLLLMLIIGALFKFGVVRPDPARAGALSLGFLLHLQISALLLNLLPVPPLDGFSAIAPWVSESARQRGYEYATASFFALFIALSFVPATRDAFWGAVFGVDEMLGVDRDLVRVAWRTFRFWD